MPIGEGLILQLWLSRSVLSGGGGSNLGNPPAASLFSGTNTLREPSFQLEQHSLPGMPFPHSLPSGSFHTSAVLSPRKLILPKVFLLTGCPPSSWLNYL